MSEPKKAEIELAGGTTIKGNVVNADIDTGGGAAIQGDATAGRDVTGRDTLQQQYEQRTVIRDLDQRRDDRHYNESRSNAGANNYNFESPDNDRIWEAIVELTKTVDSLPERMKEVERIVLPVPSPLMAAVPVALAVPGQQPITTVVPASAAVAATTPPPWMIWAAIGAIAFFAGREMSRGK